MSDQELKRSLEALKSLCDNAASSKEKALAFLVESGIVTTEGELTRDYQQIA